MEKSDKSRTRRDEQRRKYSKMDKRPKDKLVRSPRENRGRQDAQTDLHSRTGRDKKKGKTQERTERGRRNRSSSAWSEKMERVGSRQEKMEGHCLTGQSLQWAVVPMEEGSYPEPIHRVHICKPDQHYPILTFSSTFFYLVHLHQTFSSSYPT